MVTEFQDIWYVANPSANHLPHVILVEPPLTPAACFAESTIHVQPTWFCSIDKFPPFDDPIEPAYRGRKCARASRRWALSPSPPLRTVPTRVPSPYLAGLWIRKAREMENERAGKAMDCYAKSESNRKRREKIRISQGTAARPRYHLPKYIYQSLYFSVILLFQLF